MKKKPLSPKKKAWRNRKAAAKVRFLSGIMPIIHLVSSPMRMRVAAVPVVRKSSATSLRQSDDDLHRAYSKGLPAQPIPIPKVSTAARLARFLTRPS